MALWIVQMERNELERNTNTLMPAHQSVSELYDVIHSCLTILYKYELKASNRFASTNGGANKNIITALLYAFPLERCNIIKRPEPFAFAFVYYVTMEAAI